MALTLAEAQAMLTAVTTAYTSALAGSQVKYNGKDVTYQDLEMLATEMDRWQKTVDTLEAKAGGATNPGVRIATWS